MPTTQQAAELMATRTEWRCRLPQAAAGATTEPQPGRPDRANDPALWVSDRRGPPSLTHCRSMLSGNAGATIPAVETFGSEPFQQQQSGWRTADGRFAARRPPAQTAPSRIDGVKAAAFDGDPSSGKGAVCAVPRAGDSFHR